MSGAYQSISLSVLAYAPLGLAFLVDQLIRTRLRSVRADLGAERLFGVFVEARICFSFILFPCTI